jgi:thiol-disulfide isomerase/thioredoxin
MLNCRIKYAVTLISILLIYRNSIAINFKGIKFEQTLNWEQIKAKAKAEKKYIFIDCYTTWCGPCKMMNNNIFGLEKVGTFFNENFINVQVQFDRNNIDNQQIKNWYADVEKFKKMANIEAYPTFLFFNPDGELVHLITGAFNEGQEFINKASESLMPEFQYFTLYKRFKKGERGPLLANKLVPVALKANDRKTAIILGDDYVLSLNDPFTKDNLMIIYQIIKDVNSKAFKFFLNNSNKINQVLNDREFSQGVIRNQIYNEVVHPFANKAFINNRKVDWDSITQKVAYICPELSDEIILKEKLNYYKDAAMNPIEASKYFIEYLNRYGERMNQFEMNNYIWYFFENIQDENYLKTMLTWSKKNLTSGDGKYYPVYDTYANLLYRTGEIKEALLWEKKALKLVTELKQEEDIKIYKETLDKMNNGIPTWPTN